MPPHHGPLAAPCPLVLTIALTVLPSAVRATRPPGSPLRIAALPVDGVNINATVQRELGAWLVRELADAQRVDLTWGAPVYRAIARAGCSHDCPERVAEALGADVDRVVMLRAARLGRTHVLRLTVFDVHRGARVGSWQEVLSTFDQRGVRSALARMIAGFAPAPPLAGRSRPWYTRWWVWTIVGAVVAGSVATGVVLGTRGGPEETIPVYFGRGGWPTATQPAER